MGIVVTLVMLLGLIAQTKVVRSRSKNDGFLRLTSSLLLAGGLWNSAWYGIQNLGHFWGQIALLSGVVMMMTGVRIFINRRMNSGDGPMLSRSSSSLDWILWGILLICFMVYAVALIRLNLGLDIIR